MKKNVFISPVIGYQKIEVGISTHLSRRQWLIKQFCPQIGDLVWAGLSDHFPIVGVTLEGYLLEYGNSVDYHCPSSTKLDNPRELHEFLFLYRETKFDWYVVETNTGAIRYLVFKHFEPSSKEGQCKIVDVFDDFFTFMKSLEVTHVEGGILEQVNYVLDYLSVEVLSSWVRAIRPVEEA